MNTRSLTALFLLSLATGAALAQDYPSKPIRLITGNPAGGPTDLAGRYFGDRLRAVLGQPVVFENRVGAGTFVATQAVSQAPPDGYTLLYGTAGVVTGPALNKTWTLDGVKDLTPISLLVRGMTMIGARADAPYRTVDEWIAWMKANPGKLNYANISVTDLVSFEMVRNAAGVQWETIRYNGAAPAQTAVLAGQADVYSLPVGTMARGLAESGKIRLLAVLSAQRSKIQPDVPALAESRLPEVREVTKFSGLGAYWFTLMGPANLPRSIVSALHQASVKVSAEPEYVKRMADFGVEVVANTPEEFAKLIVEERVLFAREAKRAGLEPQ